MLFYKKSNPTLIVLSKLVIFYIECSKANYLKFKF